VQRSSKDIARGSLYIDSDFYYLSSQANGSGGISPLSVCPCFMEIFPSMGTKVNTVLTAAITWIYRRARNKACAAVNSFLMEMWGKKLLPLSVWPRLQQLALNPWPQGEWLCPELCRSLSFASPRHASVSPLAALAACSGAAGDAGAPKSGSAERHLLMQLRLL